MGKKKKVAIIGTGNIAPQHVSGLMEFPDRCEIVALCDIYPEKAQKMSEKFNLNCKIYKDYKEMLASNPENDILNVCTPPFTHAQISIDAMNAGKNVIVEKPMATYLRECDEMLEAQKKNQVVLSCIAQNRFRNAVYKLKKTVDSNIAGKVLCAHVNSYWWRGHSYYDLWWRGTWEKEGGGPTLNHAVHHIDMLNWLEGCLPTEVMAILANVAHDNSEVEDISLAAAKYNNGTVAQITSSVVHHGEEQGIVLQCEGAKIASPWSVKADLSGSNGFPIAEPNKELIDKLNKFYNSIPDLKYEGHTGQIENVLDAIDNNHEPLITGIDGRNTIELISAIFKAGCLKESVQLPIFDTDEFYTFDGLLKKAVRFYKKDAFVENFADARITVGNYDYLYDEK